MSQEIDEAIRRVLALSDGYMSTQNQDLLMSWNGGVMTWGELRKHISYVLRAWDKENSKEQETRWTGATPMITQDRIDEARKHG